VIAMEVPPIAAGPGALAGALAQCLPLPRGNVRALPRLSRCLVVNGSLHPTSAAQIDLGRMQGFFQGGWQCFDRDAGGTGLDRALRTGECIRRWIESSPVEALIVFGGDTAFGIHRALGSQPFEAYGEVVPGVPLSRSGDLFWITKAGGFGEPDILCDIQRRLT
jgi:D-threonate/D-erythronate kinase